MFSESIIFKVKRTFEKNRDCSFFIFECFQHAKDIFDLCQSLSIQILQLMENIPKTFMTIQIIMFSLWFFKHIKKQLKKMSTHLASSFDCDFTLLCMIMVCWFHYFKNFLFIHENMEIGTNIYNVENINPKQNFIFHKLLYKTNINLHMPISFFVLINFNEWSHEYTDEMIYWWIVEIFDGSILDQKLLVLVPLAVCLCMEFGAKISCNVPTFHRKESSSIWLWWTELAFL